MPAYLISDEEITDPATFEDYKRLVLPLIQRHGGRFLSRGAEVVMVEAGRDWTPGRMVIIEFPDMAALRAWYDDPDYAPVLAIRQASAKTTLVALDKGSA